MAGWFTAERGATERGERPGVVCVVMDQGEKVFSRRLPFFVLLCGVGRSCFSSGSARMLSIWSRCCFWFVFALSQLGETCSRVWKCCIDLLDLPILAVSCIAYNKLQMDISGAGPCSQLGWPHSFPCGRMHSVNNILWSPEHAHKQTRAYEKDRQSTQSMPACPDGRCVTSTRKTQEFGE